MASKRINLFVSENLDGHLTAQASNRGISKNAYIRLILTAQAKRTLIKRQQAKRKQEAASADGQMTGLAGY